MLWLSISHHKRPAYKDIDVEKKCIGVFNAHINDTPNTMKKNTPRLFPLTQGCVLMDRHGQNGPHKMSMGEYTNYSI